MVITQNWKVSSLCHTAVFSDLQGEAIQKLNTIWQSENRKKAQKHLQISDFRFKAQLTKQPCL